MSHRDLPAASPSSAWKGVLDWIDLLVEREVLRLRARYELSLDELRGLYISDEQVDALLRERLGDSTPDPVAALSERAQAFAPSLAANAALAALAGRLGLAAAEIDVILLALAPELDLRYETLYAYLNNDSGRRHLTVDLALRMLAAARPGATPRRGDFSPDAPLSSSGAIDWIPDAVPRSSLQRGFLLAPLVAQALMDLPLRDPGWPSPVRWMTSQDLGLASEGTRAALMALAPAPILLIGGAPRPDRTAAAAHWARLCGRPALLAPLHALGTAESAGNLASVLLAARLADATLVVDDDNAADLPVVPPGVVTASLARHRGAMVISTRSPASWTTGLADLPYARIDIAVPTVEERAQLWTRVLVPPPRPVDETSRALARSLACRFAIGPTCIAAVAQSTNPAIPAGESPHAAVSTHAAHLMATASARANLALARLAPQVRTDHDLASLVLPQNVMQQLQEIIDAIGQRDRVYREWRMRERSGRSQGLTLLFSGSSGTGKTMAASAVAHAARLDLHRIDLAGVVSKYIGETERNLEGIFEAARGANAILFFDEADALMGKRSEVKDAHDRYANLEVAYLLQRLEQHDGVVILATNLPKNLDAAFARRMHYALEFPRPNAALRERLWRGMFTPATPLAPDIDWRFIAERFETTGGEIQTIALDAAFLAAAADEPIGMHHLMSALSRRQTRQGNPGGMERYREHRHAADHQPVDGAVP
jgi:hypothetical protein